MLRKLKDKKKKRKVDVKQPSTQANNSIEDPPPSPKSPKAPRSPKNHRPSPRGCLSCSSSSPTLRCSLCGALICDNCIDKGVVGCKVGGEGLHQFQSEFSSAPELCRSLPAAQPCHSSSSSSSSSSPSAIHRKQKQPTFGNIIQGGRGNPLPEEEENGMTLMEYFLMDSGYSQEGSISEKDMYQFPQECMGLSGVGLQVCFHLFWFVDKKNKHLTLILFLKITDTRKTRRRRLLPNQLNARL